MSKLRTILAISSALAFSGCDLIGALPLIEPNTPTFPSASPTRVMTARISQRGARMTSTSLTVSCLVSVRLAPNRASATTTVPAIQGAGTTWACNLPASFVTRPNQVLQFQWVVDSGTTRVADSGVIERLLDCPNQRAAMVAEQAAVLSRFPGAMTHQQIIAAGFVPTHGFTSYAGMGVAFIRAQSAVNDLVTAATNAMINLGPPTLGTPDLLLFRPTGGSVTDVGGPDNPYLLVGWAYAQTIRPGTAQPLPPTGAPAAGDSRPMQRRPGLRCVPHHEWFLHSAGFHRPDGTFSPAPVPATTDPGDIIALPGQPPPVFHPDLWDVHFFVGADGAARIGILTPGPPLPGVTAPADSFYYPTAYD